MKLFITSKITCLLNCFKYIGLGLLGLCALSSCEDDVDFILGSTPQITGVILSQDTIRQFTDNLIFTIDYTDGDGDLGFDETDRFALFIRDVRLQDFDGFYVGPIAPPESNVPIRGSLEVRFPELFLFGSTPTEETWFEIKLVDRAGNNSDIYVTEKVLLVR